MSVDCGDGGLAYWLLSRRWGPEIMLKSREFVRAVTGGPRQRCQPIGVIVTLLTLWLVAACGARTELLPAELAPACPTLRTQNVRLGDIGRMDLLFMIDNSRS